MGEPNVGKSTLLNALIGEKLSIITNKPQTTRHRIIAILNTDEYQIVFSDTPGIIDSPHYKMQQAMNQFAYSALEDADVLMFIVDVNNEPIVPDDIAKKLKGINCPKLLILNKIDLSSQKEIDALSKWWASELPDFEQVAISALEKIGVQQLLDKIISYLPEGQPYYPKDQFTIDLSDFLLVRSSERKY